MGNTLSWLRLIYYFLFETIKNNLGKFAFIILSIISFHYAGTISDHKEVKSLVKEFVIEGDYLYITRKDVGTDYEIKKFDKSQIVEGDRLIYYKYSDFNILIWAIFVISCAVVLISTIIGVAADDDEAGWEFDDVYEKAISSIIYCLEEDGVFYYLAFNRLLSKRDSQIKRHYICSTLGISSLRDIFFCPKFKTKSQKRENLLNEIGIK